MSQNERSRSFMDFFNTHQSANCIGCGRMPAKDARGGWHLTCMKCHHAEIDRLTKFAEGKMTLGELANTPVTTTALMCNKTIEMLASTFELWGSKVDDVSFRKWVDTVVYRSGPKSREPLFDAFCWKMKKAMADQKARASAHMARHAAPKAVPTDDLAGADDVAPKAELKITTASVEISPARKSDEALEKVDPAGESAPHPGGGEDDIFSS